MIYVLAACAMLANLRLEAGATVVESLLADPAATSFAHSVNLCEVYYDFIRRSDEATARQAVNDLFAAGVVERRDMGRLLWRRVGQLKARGRISLADGFCLALAENASGQLVTSDHAEFDPLVPLGICPILFIR